MLWKKQVYDQQKAPTPLIPFLLWNTQVGQWRIRDWLMAKIPEQNDSQTIVYRVECTRKHGKHIAPTLVGAVIKYLFLPQ